MSLVCVAPVEQPCALLLGHCVKTKALTDVHCNRFQLVPTTTSYFCTQMHSQVQPVAYRLHRPLGHPCNVRALAISTACQQRSSGATALFASSGAMGLQHGLPAAEHGLAIMETGMWCTHDRTAHLCFFFSPSAMLGTLQHVRHSRPVQISQGHTTSRIISGNGNRENWDASECMGEQGGLGCIGEVDASEYIRCWALPSVPPHPMASCSLLWKLLIAFAASICRA